MHKNRQPNTIEMLFYYLRHFRQYVMFYWFYDCSIQEQEQRVKKLFCVRESYLKIFVTSDTHYGHLHRIPLTYLQRVLVNGCCWDFLFVIKKVYHETHCTGYDQILKNTIPLLSFFCFEFSQIFFEFYFFEKWIIIYRRKIQLRDTGAEFW